MSAPSSSELAALHFWRVYEDQHGVPPTRKAIAAALGVSVLRVKNLLQGLEEKGELEPEEVGPIGPAGRGPSHGLSPREQEIMDLSDGGRSAEQIAGALRIDLSYVRATIRNFDFAHCWDNSARFERAARVGSIKLAAAIAATGGAFA